MAVIADSSKYHRLGSKNMKRVKTRSQFRAAVNVLNIVFLYFADRGMSGV